MNVSKVFAIILTVCAIALGLIDRFTRLVSTSLAKIYCGKNYLQPVDGVVGDVSCGFSADMWFVVAVFLVVLFAVALLLFSKKRKDSSPSTQ